MFWNTSSKVHSCHKAEYSSPLHPSSGCGSLQAPGSDASANVSPAAEPGCARFQSGLTGLCAGGHGYRGTLRELGMPSPVPFGHLHHIASNISEYLGKLFSKLNSKTYLFFFSSSFLHNFRVFNAWLCLWLINWEIFVFFISILNTSVSLWIIGYLLWIWIKNTG